MADDTKSEFKVGEEVEVHVGEPYHGWFVGTIDNMDSEKAYKLSFDLFDDKEIDPNVLRPKSELRKGDKVVINNDKSLPTKGVISNILAEDQYEIRTDTHLSLNKKRNEIGLLNASSEDTPVSDLASGASPAGASASTMPVVPAYSATLTLTEKDKAGLKDNIDYKAYLIAEKVAKSGAPIVTLGEELNKFPAGDYGTSLQKHIKNTEWDKKLNKSGRYTPYNNAAILASIKDIISHAQHEPVVKRFLTDYKTNEQELLAYPHLSSYLIYQDIGVHSSDAFVKAVCDRMQGRLSEPLKKILREKRKELYETSFDETPKAIPPVEDLEAFFKAEPDKATILLFITMMRSMLTIEPLLNAHYKSFGRALQKTFKTPGLYLNKSAFTKGKSGSKTVKDLVNKERTKTAVYDLLERLKKSSDNEEQIQISKQINANIDEYKRILGEHNELYEAAKKISDKLTTSVKDKVMMDSSYWKRFKKYLGFSGGKRTKYRNRRTRRPQHVMRRKTHHKKRRSAQTRRQLHVRR
jgi:hypothetical protein